MARAALAFPLPGAKQSAPANSMHYVSYGSWLCENAKLLDDDRRSYSSKTALGHQLAIAFNFKIELKNVILVAFRTFAFLHSQGQKLP